MLPDYTLENFIPKVISMKDIHILKEMSETYARDRVDPNIHEFSTKIVLSANTPTGSRDSEVSLRIHPNPIISYTLDHQEIVYYLSDDIHAF